MSTVEKSGPPSGPFSHAPNTIDKTMKTVCLALMPATAFNLWLFGWPAIFIFAITLISAVAFEAFCLRVTGREVGKTLYDGSAILTGWLLAMSLPPWAPWWLGVLGAFVAIVLAKQAYGGLGQNLFNPAMVGRVALLVSFPVVMTSWVSPHPLFTAQAPGFTESLAIVAGVEKPTDAMSSATPLGHIKTELSRGVPVSKSVQETPSLRDMIVGHRAGSLGETSAVLILAGGLFMLFRRTISWHIPVAMMGTLFVAAELAHFIDAQRYSPGLFHLLSGATFLGAFFIATDYVSSPLSKPGLIVYGVGCGLLTWVIRTFAGYPEGVAFAVLLMNSLTPVIDQYTRPRIFGRDRSGAPLKLQQD